MNGNTQLFSILCSRFQKQLPGDIGPQAAKTYIQHIDGAPDSTTLQNGLRDRQTNQGSGVQLWSNPVKIDGPTGKPGAGIGVNIPPVEGVAFSGVGEPVYPFINLPNLPDAVQTDDMGESAVVGGHNIFSGVGFGNYAFPVGPHTGIHNGNEDSFFRPIGNGLNQAIACLPYGVGSNIMGQIVNFQLRADAVSNTVHGADGTVHKTKVRLKNQWLHKAILLHKIPVYHTLFSVKSQSSVPDTNMRLKSDSLFVLNPR